MSVIEQLAKEALQDSYLKKIINNLEKELAFRTFVNQGDYLENISSKYIYDSLRFADILATSRDDEAKNLSYKILSLIYALDLIESEVGVEQLFHSILIKLGNFPAISVLSDREDALKESQLSLEIRYENTLKRIIQRVPGNDELTFTDKQYYIFQKLIENPHYSFSGPTSLGKTFIFQSFIRFLIQEKSLKENIAILVPTRALINEVSLKVKKELAYNSDYKIITHPEIPHHYQNQDKNFIFVFTPERLLSFFSEPDNPVISYLFVDEAQKIISEKDTRNPIYYHSILQAQKRSVRLYFASPNISNPELYLELFDKDKKIIW